MQDYELDNFFEVLLNDENERKILKLISKGLNDDEILDILLTEESGCENP